MHKNWILVVGYYPHKDTDLSVDRRLGFCLAAEAKACKAASTKGSLSSEAIHLSSSGTCDLKSAGLCFAIMRNIVFACVAEDNISSSALVYPCWRRFKSVGIED